MQASKIEYSTLAGSSVMEEYSSSLTFPEGTYSRPKDIFSFPNERGKKEEKQEHLKKIFNSSNNLLENLTGEKGFNKEFKKKLKTNIKELEKTKDEDLDKSLDYIKNKIDKAHSKFKKINAETLSKELRDPSIGFMVEKHYKISNYFFEETKDEPGEVKEVIEDLKEFDGVDNLDKLIEERWELIKLGIFLAGEPLFVTSAIYADKYNKIDFISKYSELVDWSASRVSDINPEKYNEIIGFDRTNLDKKTSKRLKKGLEKLKNSNSMYV